VKKLKKRNSVLSEIEFAAPYGCYNGITGSNGKTTTTMLTYHVKSAGLNVGLRHRKKSFACKLQIINMISMELVVFNLMGCEF
jgi:UDP-N-acetylmuramoylalanine--D-glutamate ligase